MPAAATAIVGLLAASVSLAARPNVQGVPPTETLQSGIPVARIFATGPGLEWWRSNAWARLADGTLIRTGDRLRTGAAAAAIQFPWTTLVVSPSSTLSVAPSIVLTANLAEGRVEQRAMGEDIIKLRTPEAVVRGSGHVIVRRVNGKTFVSALEGTFDVATGPGTLRLDGGNGTVVLSGVRPSPPAPLSAMGKEMHPGTDPVYFRRNETVRLHWEGAGAQHRVQIVAFDSDQVVHDADVRGHDYSLALPLGLYRWRVSSVPPDGPDGRPSPDGLICVVED